MEELANSSKDFSKGSKFQGSWSILKFNSVMHKICEAEGPFGVCSGSVWGPFRIRSGSVWGPFGVRSGFVQDPFGVRLGSVGGPFRIRSGSVRAPFGPILDQNFQSQNFKISKMFNLCSRTNKNICKKIFKAFRNWVGMY